MRGELRRHLPLDRLQGSVGMGAGEQMKNIANARERPPAAFQRGDGVIESRLRGLSGDGGDFPVVIGQRALEGREEMRWRDAREGRRAERLRPDFEQRIGGT